jgi:hypothetical protein
MSDHQRQRAYRAEWKVRHLGVHLPSADHVKALIKIAERLPWIPEGRKGCMVEVSMVTTRAYYGGGVMHIPAKSIGPSGDWAWTDIVVLHEYAHHLATTDHGHDDVFTSTLLRLLRGVGRDEVADALEAAYKATGAAVRDCQEVTPNPLSTASVGPTMDS